MHTNFNVMETIKNKSVSMGTKNELKAFNYAKGTSEKISKKIASIKNDNVSLFRMHKDSIKLLLSGFSKELSLNGVDIKSQAVKDLKTKDKISPIELVGAYSLDKFIKFLGIKTNFYSLMSTHVKSIYQTSALNDEERQTIFARGKELNELKTQFLNAEINAEKFVNELFTYFPSFYEGLKNEKIAPNVAVFLYENVNEIYDTLKISRIHDVAEEIKESEILKNKGLEGLIAYQAEREAKQGAKIKKVVGTAKETAA